jgi:lipoprotein-anchoring transpeptidase ErfK/SrfK
VRRGVDDQTPLGSWRIQDKYRDVHLRGQDANGAWDDFVQYWLPFDGSVGFHDASWQTFPFGGAQYHSDGSHACVHLPTAMAAWVYGWAGIGTAVTIEA